MAHVVHISFVSSCIVDCLAFFFTPSKSSVNSVGVFIRVFINVGFPRTFISSSFVFLECSHLGVSGLTFVAELLFCCCSLQSLTLFSVMFGSTILIAGPFLFSCFWLVSDELLRVVVFEIFKWVDYQLFWVVDCSDLVSFLKVCKVDCSLDVGEISAEIISYFLGWFGSKNIFVDSVIVVEKFVYFLIRSLIFQVYFSFRAPTNVGLKLLTFALSSFFVRTVCV